MPSYPPMIFKDEFYEHHNIAWRIEPGQLEPANPLMEPAHPWDSAAPFNGGTVLKDPIDGLWKCWGIAFPHVENFKRGQFFNSLAYAQSEDGAHWTRPMLEGFPCRGQKRSNVLMAFDDIGKVGPISVIVDPGAEPRRRYEMFVWLQLNYGKPEGRVIRGLPLAPGHKNGHPNGIYRFLSPDGIHWQPEEGPLDIQTSDSIYISKEQDGTYTAHHKVGIEAPAGGFVPYDVGAGSQRILVRRTSPDGSSWSPFSLQITPDWRDAQDTQFMDLIPIRQGKGYAAVVGVYHCLNQMMDFQFAGSPDGMNWFRPFPRVPCLANHPLGESGGSLLYGSKNLIEDGDNLYLYYNAMKGLHGDVYGKTDDEYLQYGSFCRASWQKGRLWSAVPANAGPNEARLTTHLLAAGGKELQINGLTQADGEISAGLYLLRAAYELEDALVPVPGFSRADCLGFRGDSRRAVISWKNQKPCPEEKVSVRFYLRKARLYGFEFA